MSWMNWPVMPLRTGRRTLAAAIVLVGACAAASDAAVFVDPTLVTGSDAIDPSGSETIDQRPGTLAEATLEARPDFRGAFQALGLGFSQGAGSSNILSFTDPTLPDVRLTIGGTNPNAAAGTTINQTGRVTSGTDGMQFLLASGATAAQTVTLLVEFGDYTGTTFTPGGAVDAAAFTVGNARSGQAFTVLFKDAAGNTLETQTMAGGTDTTGTGNAAGIEGYFGYGGGGVPSAAVSSILITRTGDGNIGASIDDLGFTSAVPEPSSAAVVGVLCGGLLMGRRRGGR